MKTVTVDSGYGKEITVMGKREDLFNQMICHLIYFSGLDAQYSTSLGWSLNHHHRCVNKSLIKNRMWHHAVRHLINFNSCPWQCSSHLLPNLFLFSASSALWCVRGPKIIHLSLLCYTTVQHHTAHDDNQWNERGQEWGPLASYHLHLKICYIFLLAPYCLNQCLEDTHKQVSAQYLISA